MEKVEIYIATHKRAKMPNKEEYLPIQVGAVNKEELGYLKDSTEDNISHKNSNYCELTALYWIWKNSKADIVGVVHYRRYFFNNMYSRKLKNILSKDKIITYLNKNDIIVPKEDYIYKYNVEKQYGIKHNIEDYKKCREIIKKESPEYTEAFDIVSKRKYFYPYNMFIMRKDLFEEYAQWLFNILFKLEEQIDISRIFGLQ